MHRDKQVIDVNKRALEAGARIGMALTEAKALSSNASFVAWEEEEYKLEQAEWLDLCTEFSDRIEPVEQHAAYLDFSLHPEPEVLIHRLQAILHRKYESMSIALAPNKWIAQQKALNNDAPFANWSVHTLPVTHKTKLRLEFLGYRTIDSLKGVSLETLRGQFDDEGLLVYQSVRGGGIQEVQALYPPRAASGVYRFETLTQDESQIAQAIGAIAKKLSARLVDRDWQGSSVKVVIEGENGSVQVRHRTFSKAFQDYRSVFVALKMVVGQLENPVECIRVSLPQLVEAPRFQLEAGMRFGLNTGRIDVACEKVRAVYGEKSIAKVAELPEPRRKALLRAWKDVAAWQ